MDKIIKSWQEDMPPFYLPSEQHPAQARANPPSLSLDRGRIRHRHCGLLDVDVYLWNPTRRCKASSSCL